MSPRLRALPCVLLLLVLSTQLAVADATPGFNDTALLFVVGDPNRRGRMPTTPPTGVEIRVAMEGFLAQTTLRMDVTNRTADDLAEAVLDFDLPEGSVVMGLKLSVAGMMVDGVGVEKWLARTAYEREVGRRVDPAHLSLIDEDRYRLQFYPIARGQTRSVEIGWIQPLREHAGRLIYDFPFVCTERVPFDALTAVAVTGTTLQVEHAPARLERTETGSRVTYQAPAGRYGIHADFTLSYPDDGILGQAWAGAWGGDRYTSVRFPESRRIRPTVERVSVIWDASFSRSFRDHGDEVRFLRSCLAEMGTHRIDLFELRNGIVPAGSYTDQDQWEDLAGTLERMVYDGHSDVADVVRHLSDHPDVPTIFATDLLEYYPGVLPQTPSPLAVVVGGEPRSWWWYDPVEQLRGATWGSIWYTGHTDRTSGARRIARFLSERSKVSGDTIFEFDGQGDLRTVHAKGARPTGTEGGVRAFTLIPDYPRYVEGRRLLTGYSPRTWAYRDVGALASRWQVVSPYSSLLVLETPEQYVRWGIAPPAEVPWDRSRYDALLREQQAGLQQTPEHLVARQLQKTLEDVDQWLDSDHSEAGVTGRYGDFLDNEVEVSSLPRKYASVGSRGGCFPAGTLVRMGDGRQVPIETVLEGEAVSSHNPETGALEPRLVQATIVQPYTGDMLDLRFGASELAVTGNHPILVLSGRDLEERKSPVDLPPGDQDRLGRGRWVEARDLVPGDLLAADGGTQVLQSVRRRNVQDTPVYNLTVEANHTYLTGAAGVVAHNKGMAEGSAATGSAGAGSAYRSAAGAELPQQTVETTVRQESFYGFSTLPFVSEADAYRRYLDLRARNLSIGGFYVEAARWFARNGAMQTALLVLSNLREYHMWNADRIQGAMVLEALGMHELALVLLKEAEEGWENPGMKVLTYLAELYRLAGSPEGGRYLLPRYLPRQPNDAGLKDTSMTPALGGAQLTLYLDALLLADGETPDLSVFGMTDLPGRGWDQGLRIKALWSGYDDYGLVVVEPGGEAVFYDNFRSASGGLYWTTYRQPSGPDEYFALHPVPGEYRIYLALREASTKPAGSPDYVPVRVSVVLPAGTPGDRMKLFHVDIPVGAGIFPVGSVNVGQTR